MEILTVVSGHADMRLIIHKATYLNMTATIGRLSGPHMLSQPLLMVTLFQLYGRVILIYMLVQETAFTVHH